MPARKTAKESSSRRSKPSPAAKTGDRIVIANVNVPGHTTSVDAGMYNAMRRAMLKVLPSKAPGLTQAQIRDAVVPHLPADLFPGGAKAGWWAKAVQLDLEARGALVRESTKPLRWHKSPRK